MKTSSIHCDASDAINIQILSLPTFLGRVKVPISNIVRLEGCRNYTIFILVNGQRVTYSKTISLFEDELSYPFIRIHKSCIINLEHLREHWEQGKKEFLMTDGQSVSVSRRRRSAVKRWMKSYREIP